MTDYTQIILAVIALVHAVVVTFLIPWLKTKIEAEKLEKLHKLCITLVDAAETYFKSGEGEAKKGWVIHQLKANGINFNENLIEDYIESIVRERTAYGVINNEFLPEEEPEG